MIKKVIYYIVAILLGFLSSVIELICVLLEYTVEGLDNVINKCKNWSNKP